MKAQIAIRYRLPILEAPENEQTLGVRVKLQLGMRK